MANRKYDYSDELSPSAELASETARTSETEKPPLVSAEEMRRQWLERRNDALANEFHNLKPGIADAHKLLQDLINGIGAYAGTMLNLQDLLKSSFPIRFTDTDRQAMQKELHVIADDAVSHIRKEREKANRDIHRNDSRISMTQTTFWFMIALLLTLASFFAVTVFANVKQLHSGILAEIIAVYAGLVALASSTVVFIFYKRKH